MLGLRIIWVEKNSQNLGKWVILRAVFYQDVRKTFALVKELEEERSYPGLVLPEEFWFNCRTSFVKNA